VNRVVLKFNKRGFIDRVLSDEEIEVYWVEPRFPHDRVNLVTTTLVGEKFVDKEICGYPIGHATDHIHGPLKALPKSRPRSPTSTSEEV
jgi:hypothetical protein